MLAVLTAAFVLGERGPDGLRPDETRDLEVDRLVGLGATFVADHREPDGTGWAVLTDPEGNEFCVLRGRTELGGS